MSRNGASGVHGRMSEHTAGYISIRTHPLMFLFVSAGFIVCLFGAAVAGYCYGKRTANSNAQGTAGAEQTSGNGPSAPANYNASGPWGEVECERVVIEAPADCLPAISADPRPPHWFFKGYSAAQLTQFFNNVSARCQLPHELLRTNAWEISQQGVRVRPSAETLFALTSECRKGLYEELAKYAENVEQANPFHWFAKDEEALFKSSKIAPATFSSLQRLCYRHGDLTMFADLNVLLASLPDVGERSALRLALSRQFGMLLRLNLKPNTDTDQLLRYWGVGGMGKTFRPVLEAAARTGQGRKIPVLGLLPPPVRSRIYTFPASPPASELDAFWTAATFFESKPVLETKDKLDWLRRCRSEYHPIDSDPRFGDVLMLTRQDGRLMHSCVYLADDVVYTKNGSGPTNPWMLMKIADLLHHFSAAVPEDEQLRTTYIRANNS